MTADAEVEQELATMQIFDAEAQVVRDLKEEGKIIAEKQFAHFLITALRHPTLGKVVIVEDHDGKGAIVETEY
jgi:hypothetical protein